MRLAITTFLIIAAASTIWGCGSLVVKHPEPDRAAIEQKYSSLDLMITAQDAERQSYPSQLARPRRFLLRQRLDMREFVCESSAIQDRVKRQVCVIDFITSTNAPPQNWEFAVGVGKRLETVLTSLRLRSMPRQVRVFKESSIEQGKMGKETFIVPDGLLIEPGDLIIFTSGDFP